MTFKLDAITVEGLSLQLVIRMMEAVQEDNMDGMGPILPLLVKNWQDLRVSLMTEAWLDSCFSSSSQNMTRVMSE